MRTRTSIFSFVLGLLSATSLTAAAGVLEGDGAPPSMVGVGCETPTEVLPKVVTPWSPDYGPGGFIEGTG
jgi:hypothetical protein